jgi:adenylate kinase family enzyme
MLDPLGPATTAPRRISVINSHKVHPFSLGRVNVRLVRRVLVAGNTGAGKTTAARRVAQRRGLLFHEVDELAFRPGWAPDPGYVGALREIARGDRWVLDSWGDPRVRDELWRRADTVVWLDYPLRVVLPRLVRRSVRRTVRREQIFNGNVESYREWFSRDHPVRSALRDHRPRRAETARRLTLFPHLRVVQFCSPRQAERWLASLPPGT